MTVLPLKELAGHFLNPINRCPELAYIGLDFRQGKLPEHRPVVAFDAGLDNPKPDTFEIPSVLVGKPNTVKNHLQVSLGTDRMTRPIFVVEYVKGSEMVHHGTVKSAEHLRVNEIKPDAGFDQNVRTLGVDMKTADEVGGRQAVRNHLSWGFWVHVGGNCRYAAPFGFDGSKENFLKHLMGACPFFGPRRGLVG